MKWLLVAEKESAGKNFAETLEATELKNGYCEGDDLVVTWAQGHLIGLKEPEEHDPKFKTWRVEDLPLVFNINTNLKVMQPALFKKIKNLIDREDICGIINAGDPGREGELIQRWIYRMAGNRKPVVRLWCDTLTPNAIKKAYDNLRDSAEFDLLFEAGETRAELDQFLGYNYSRLLTLTRATNLTISYGRCQTPLLNQIIQRDYEIENFVPVPYWEIKSIFQSDGICFSGTMIDSSNRAVMQFDNQASAENVFSKIQQYKKGRVLSCSNEIKKKKPPLLFNLNELQKTMAKKYHYDADKTLSLAQSLYDTHKIMSYPRTDSRYLSSDLFEVIPSIVQCLNFGKFSPLVSNIKARYNLEAPKSYFNDNKVTDHHALLPAENEKISSIYPRLNQEEKNVFDAVALSLLAIFYPSYEYSSTEIITQVSDFSFLSKGTMVLEYGWKALYKDDDEKEENKDEKIPSLEENQEIAVDKMDVKSSKTKPKKRFTTDTILALMDMYHIGTSATQANIIKELTKPKGKNKIAYVERKDDTYISTTFSRKFIEFIPENLKSLELVGIIDKQLEDIANGKLTKQKLIDSQIEELEKNIKLLRQDTREKLQGDTIVPENALKCPLCGRYLIKYGWGYGCSGYKNTENPCTFSISNTKSDKKLSDKSLEALITNGKTGVIKGFKKKDGTEFEQKLFLVDGKVLFEYQVKNANGSSSKKGSGSKSSSTTNLFGSKPSFSTANLFGNKH